MPYIGAKELKASDIRRFDVTSSTSATHTLTWTPPTEQSLIVTINGIKQHEDAYSVSGTTLTLSSPLVATDKLEVIGINDIGTTITPAQNSVDTDKIVDDAVTSAKLANAINITSGNSLTIDSGATITNNGTNGGGFGKVLQVVNVEGSATSNSTTSNSYVGTGHSISITPSSTSSYIVIDYWIPYQSSTTGAGPKFALYKDGSLLKDWSTNYAGYGLNYNHHTLTHYHNPATTNAITYTTYFAVYGSATIYIGAIGGMTWYLRATEIEG